MCGAGGRPTGTSARAHEVVVFLGDFAWASLTWWIEPANDAAKDARDLRSERGNGRDNDGRYQRQHETVFDGSRACVILAHRARIGADDGEITEQHANSSRDRDGERLAR
jgi:hypothetical protein